MGGTLRLRCPADRRVTLVVACGRSPQNSSAGHFRPRETNNGPNGRAGFAAPARLPAGPHRFGGPARGAFAIDGLSRLLVAAIHVPDEFEPYSYVPRLVTFALIIAAVVVKNRK